ncbi:MAG: type II toxin-antitoxin system HicB family antitoxin [Thermomicrobiales bacterium]
MNFPLDELEVTAADQIAASRYAVVVARSDQDGVFIASAPDIPNLHTHGLTREATAKAADEVIALWIAGAREMGDVVPSPRFRVVVN